MALNIEAMVDAIASHAAGTGLFERVNLHEPKSAPGAGMHAAVWAQQIRAVPQRSGLAATSARVVFTIRLYRNMTAEPQDSIDPEMMRAVDTLIGLVHGDFDLGGTVAEVDLLGMYGDPLEATAGYLNQDGKLYRIIDLNIPMVINDAWAQSS